ncbi:alpha/beta fold hydrolase [Streptomyces atratus]|uniref:alpha/beta fold hydrolase n=1 Tax=Streptomyces atratus TaxID=1893 RepID=UPI0022533E6E|nr:alpha/beta hydrolase [Streptomyces atratus]MCX5343342.1 alpha/beta hydrolase [Streptomyces atratus]
MRTTGDPAVAAHRSADPHWSGVHARAALDAGDPVEAMRIHMRDIVPTPAGAVDAMFADQRVRAALGVGMDRFAALGMPTTLVEGDLSPAHLRERLADLAATLPNARIVTLAGQGHVAHLTAPDTLADAVREMAKQVLHA